MGCSVQADLKELGFPQGTGLNHQEKHTGPEISDESGVGQILTGKARRYRLKNAYEYNLIGCTTRVIAPFGLG